MGNGHRFELLLILAVVAVGLLSVAVVASPTGDDVRKLAFQSDDSNVSVDMDDRIDASGGSPTKSIAPGDEITVVTTQGRFIEDEYPDLVAFDEAGEIVYYHDGYDVYYDVDPVPEEKYTIEFVGVEHLNESECPEFLSSYYTNTSYANSVSWSTWKKYVTAEKNDYDPVRDEDSCTRDIFERVNLTTGEVTREYEIVTPDYFSGRTHDIDRINETHLAVADIFLDRVYVVDTRTDNVTWQWMARDDFDPNTTGGPYTQDWTHVNDVEVLPDDRLMVSLRNHDQVVFLDTTKPSESALLENWTLGADDDYSTLNEQHNPDYVPAEDGGPSVIVGDSQNNRTVEYRRTPNGSERTNGSRASSELHSDGAWERTWVWTDERVEWPRDADRLPNGNTLVVDTRGGRVLEVGPDGEIVWGVEIGIPYDAERLGTGDESEGGPAANRTAKADNRDSSTLAGH